MTAPALDLSRCVHLHARTGPCRAECGAPCADVNNRATMAYRGYDPERVTCPTCLETLRKH